MYCAVSVVGLIKWSTINFLIHSVTFQKWEITNTHHSITTSSGCGPPALRCTVAAAHAHCVMWPSHGLGGFVLIAATVCNLWDSGTRRQTLHLQLPVAPGQGAADLPQLDHGSAVHIGPVGLENSKLKTARLDLRMYRTCDWNRAESDGITLNQFCSRQYAVTGAFLRWKLLVDNISNYCFDRKFGFTMGYGCLKCTADSNETQTNPNQYLLVKFVWWNVNFL